MAPPPHHPPSSHPSLLLPNAHTTAIPHSPPPSPTPPPPHPPGRSEEDPYRNPPPLRQKNEDAEHRPANDRQRALSGPMRKAAAYCSNRAKGFATEICPNDARSGIHRRPSRWDRERSRQETTPPPPPPPPPERIRGGEDHLRRCTRPGRGSHGLRSFLSRHVGRLAMIPAARPRLDGCARTEFVRFTKNSLDPKGGRGRTSGRGSFSRCLMADEPC